MLLESPKRQGWSGGSNCFLDAGSHPVMMMHIDAFIYPLIKKVIRSKHMKLLGDDDDDVDVDVVAGGDCECDGDQIFTG